MAKDSVCYKTRWIIHKFRDPESKIARILRQGGQIPYLSTVFEYNYMGSEEFEDNVLLNTGIQYMIEIICGIGTTTKWDSSNARLGVGSSTTAESPTQTDLQDAGAVWKTMDSGYPQRSGQTAIWRATFGGTEANFAWNEFGVDNGSTVHKVLNRKVASKGTKSSGETWTLELQITWS